MFTDGLAQPVSLWSVKQHRWVIVLVRMPTCRVISGVLDPLWLGGRVGQGAEPDLNPYGSDLRKLVGPDSL